MPKRILYTCDRCGKEYFEPEFFTDGAISELSYDLQRAKEEGGTIHYVTSKSGYRSQSAYFCPECTKEFNKLLKNFGFKRLYSTSIVDESPLEL